MADTGPPYPVLFTQNGVGQFVIGESSIGTLPGLDVWKTVISQYANSPILTRLIEDIFAFVDQTENIDRFYDDIWNIDSAQGYGLDVWGRIVGVGRVVQVQNTQWFGFNEAMPGVLGFNTGVLVIPAAFGFKEGAGQPFGQAAFRQPAQIYGSAGTGGPLFSGVPLTSNYRLTDPTYRQLIMAKAAANITNGSIAAINKILRDLFPGRGNAYVTEGQALTTSWFGFCEQQNANGFNQQSFYSGAALETMVMTYVFKFQLSAVELAIVQQSGVLPKSTGVSSSVVVSP